MYEESRIVGKNFFPISLSFPENIDVDEQWQFIVAEKLYSIIKKNYFKN